MEGGKQTSKRSRGFGESVSAAGIEARVDRGGGPKVHGSQIETISHTLDKTGCGWNKNRGSFGGGKTNLALGNG